MGQPASSPAFPRQLWGSGEEPGCPRPLISTCSLPEALYDWGELRYLTKALRDGGETLQESSALPKTLAPSWDSRRVGPTRSTLQLSAWRGALQEAAFALRPEPLLSKSHSSKQEPRSCRSCHASRVHPQELLDKRHGDRAYSC